MQNNKVTERLTTSPQNKNKHKKTIILHITINEVKVRVYQI